MFWPEIKNKFERQLPKKLKELLNLVRQQRIITSALEAQVKALLKTLQGKCLQQKEKNQRIPVQPRI